MYSNFGSIYGLHICYYKKNLFCTNNDKWALERLKVRKYPKLEKELVKYIEKSLNNYWLIPTVVLKMHIC